jgi:hypothetical protein
MKFQHQLTPVLLFSVLVAGVILSWIANRKNTSPWYVPFYWRERDSFTATGWRFRRWSYWCVYLAFTVIAGDQIFA